MITLERSDHFFNSPEAGEILNSTCVLDVEDAVYDFLDRTGIVVDPDELVEDYMRRV